MAPAPAAEQEDQLLFGETFDVLFETGEFAFGQARRATALNGMAYIYAIQGKKSRTAVDSLKQALGQHSLPDGAIGVCKVRFNEGGRLLGVICFVTRPE